MKRLSDSTKAIISILLNFIPGKIGLASGIDALKDALFGHTSAPRWYTIKEYCTGGYEYYAWKRIHIEILVENIVYLSNGHLRRYYKNAYFKKNMEK